MQAVIVGVTGATGTDLLQLLLADNACNRVDVFARRALDVRHEKLHVHVINFDAPKEWRERVKGDVLFSCLGTTLKAAGSTDRSGEVTGIRVIKFLNRFGILRSQKPLSTEILAQAMINAAKANAAGVAKLKGAEIWRRAGAGAGAGAA